jgi:hypothetical protein
MIKEICQACGKELNSGDKVIAVRYGLLWYKKHTSISKARVDYFCYMCAHNVAICDNALD